MHINDDPFASIKLLDKELQKNSYTSEQYQVGERLYYRFESPHHGVWLTRAAVVTYPFTHSGLVNLSVRKDVAYAFLKNRNISVPATYMIKQGDVDREEIETIIASHKKLIVKPVDASLSRGLTLDLDKIEDVLPALELAFEQSDKAHAALIQEQVDGQELRFVVMRGKVEAVILRESPRVVGDGASSIRQLIIEENKLRKDIVVPYLSYPQLTADIIDASFLSDTSVPEIGNVVELGRGTMIRSGASIYNIMEQVDASYLRLAESIATYIGAAFIVLDVFVKDHSVPMTPVNYSFIEFNTAPELKMFYSCRDGKHFDVLKHLVPMINTTLEKHL